MKKYIGLLCCLSFFSCGDSEMKQALRYSMQPMADEVQLTIVDSRFIPQEKDEQIFSVTAHIKNYGPTPVMVNYSSFHIETEDGITITADGLETQRLDNNCNVNIRIAPNATFSCRAAFVGRRMMPRKLIFTDVPGMYDAPVAYFNGTKSYLYSNNY